MGWVRPIVGILIVAVGAIWLLQGIRVLPGSFMTGSMRWTLIGAGCICVGAVVALRGRR